MSITDQAKIKIGDDVFYVFRGEPRIQKFKVTDIQEAKDENENFRLFIDGSNKWFLFDDEYCFLNEKDAENKLKREIRKSKRERF